MNAAHAAAGSSGAGDNSFYRTDLRAEAELDLIHEDESVGRRRLRPVQHDAALQLVDHLRHHLPGDVVRPRCGQTTQT